MQYASMSSMDLELDGKMSDLETEWRRAHDAVTAARADYERVLDCCRANGGLIDIARIRLGRAEAAKARIFAKIEKLENCMVGEPEG
jgi:hypothetical protein